MEKLRKIADGPRFNMTFGHNFSFFDTKWRGKYKIEYYIVLVVFWTGDRALDKAYKVSCKDTN